MSVSLPPLPASSLSSSSSASTSSSSAYRPDPSTSSSSSSRSSRVPGAGLAPALTPAPPLPPPQSSSIGVAIAPSVPPKPGHHPPSTSIRPVVVGGATHVMPPSSRLGGRGAPNGTTRFAFGFGGSSNAPTIGGGSESKDEKRSSVVKGLASGAGHAAMNFFSPDGGAAKKPSDLLVTASSYSSVPLVLHVRSTRTNRRVLMFW